MSGGTIADAPPPYAAQPVATQGLLPYQAVVGTFLAIKLAYILFAGPIADEAYYWLWGQRPGLSYYDHPPLGAWVLGLSDTAFGRSLLALRWPTLAALFGTLLIYRDWARRFAGPEWKEVFWRGAAIYLASTTFGFFTSLAMHDYLLVFLLLLAAHGFVPVLSAFGEGQPFRPAGLYGGALALGLAGLTKYSAVLFGLGLFLYILFTPRLRPLLRRVHLYGAALLAIALQAPILLWNLGNGFASFRYHLADRHPEDWLSRVNGAAIAEFLLVSLLLISPFLVVPFARFLLAQPETGFERTARGLAVWVFWLASALFLSISFFDRVWWWWNLPAYVLLMPFAGKYMRERLLIWAHVALGLALQLSLLVSSVLLPLPVVFGMEDPVRSPLFGWDQLPVPVRAAAAAHQVDFIATMTSEVGGVLAFALDDPQVAALTPALNQFDFWFEPEMHRGRNALVVIRDGFGRDFIARQFQSVTVLEEVPVVRFGYTLGTYQLLLGRGYAPLP